MDLVAAPDRVRELERLSRDWPSWSVSPTELIHLEMLLSGGYSPLRALMDRHTYAMCEQRSHLPDGTLWPLPLALDVTAERARTIQPAEPLVLRDHEGLAIAVMRVSDAWHDQSGHWRIGGDVEGLRLPEHHDFSTLRLTPDEVRLQIQRRGWIRIIALHVAAETDLGAIERGCHRAAQLDAGVVILPLVSAGDAATPIHYARIRSIRAEADRFEAMSLVSLLPSAVPLGTRRGALLGALVAANLGCTHAFVDGAALDRDLADAGGSASDLAVVPMPLPLPAGAGEQDQRRPSVPASPAGRPRGLTLFFTGLSGSGKSAIANAVRARLLERGDRPVTLLDGDLVRQHLSSDLGFSRADRDRNIRRIGFVAAEITRHGGIAICAPIAPYDHVRRKIREQIEAVGAFVLVFVSTPLDVCEQRDRKGLYAKARAGLLKEFTGVSDSYEAPTDAELVIDTTDSTIRESADRVLGYLEGAGLLPPDGHGPHQSGSP